MIISKELCPEWEKLNINLKIIANLADHIAVVLFDEQLEVTSIWRKKTIDSGVHEHYRAIDFRCLETMERTYRLIEIVNEIYTYDPDRLHINVAHTNPYHGTAPHIHLQVHPNTTCMTPKQVEGYKSRQLVQARNFKPITLT